MGAYGSKRFKAELESLRRNDPTLTVLDYESAGLGDEGARALAEALRGNETLRRLRLGQSGLSALGLQRICRALCDTSIAPCHLRRLDLVRHTYLSEYYRVYLLAIHPIFKRFQSSGTSVGNAVGDNGAKCLAAVSLLRHSHTSSLSLSLCSFSLSPFFSLPQSFSLLLSLSDQLLTRAPSLRHLTAGGCGIGDEGASSIAQALARNRTLKTLDLR